MQNNSNSKPCLAQTPQGFSVSYNERFLYSKYNPEKSILQTIEKLQILPDTALLCCSPVLQYGLAELNKKLPENCKMFLCEADDELLSFSEEQYSSLPQNCIRLSKTELYNLPEILQSFTFRRAVRIDFSAGTQFHQDFYNQLFSACVNSIKTFWVNRITLSKFGRRYSKNFFQNLKNLPSSTPIQYYFHNISKPILVLGAGESINSTINLLSKSPDVSKAFYIICVDTALPSLLKKHIKPNAVFIEEAQSIISKAFLGTFNKNFHVFAGLSSLPLLQTFFIQKNISYFTTLYTNAEFIQNIKNCRLLPPENIPMGSVGLTAVFYALKFRKNESIPVYISGLDFSYSSGVTHAKGTLAHTNRLLLTTRLSPIENYAAAFGPGTKQVLDIFSKNLITSEVLSSYATLFKSQFSSTKNLFDIRTSGLDLGLQFIDQNKLFQKPTDASVIISFLDNLDSNNNSDEITPQLQNYFSEERKALIELRNILTGNIKLPQEKAEQRITELASKREYLFLHFPDGYKFSTDISFLKRLRTEIDFFLKWI